MSTQRFSPEFKEEAVRQVVECGYSVAEVAARLGVSSHSLYKWVKAVTPDKSEKHASARHQQALANSLFDGLQRHFRQCPPANTYLTGQKEQERS